MKANYNLYPVIFTAGLLAGLYGISATENASRAETPYADLGKKSPAEKIEIIRKAAAEKDEKAVPAILALLSTEKDRNIIVNAYSALGSIGHTGEKNEVSNTLTEKAKTESDPVLQYAAVTSVYALIKKENAAEAAEAVRHVNKFPADSIVKDLTDKIMESVEKKAGIENKKEKSES